MKDSKNQSRIPALLKWIFFIFMAILIPMNWITYGLSNFLWFSDITLILAFLAVIFESTFCASLAAVSGILFEFLWIISFFGSLLFKFRWELTAYMFNPMIPIWVRSLSLFHIFLPPLLIWLTIRLGYFRKAWLIQTGIIWLAILLTWFLTDSSENINFVFGYQKLGWSPMPYLIGEMAAMALLLLITHFFILGIQKISQK